MIVKLTDDEIREILAEALADKLAAHVLIPPDECWFECEAGLIEDGKVDDIHEVNFCYKTN